MKTDGFKLYCLSNLNGNLQFATNGSCSGRGCCQALLPPEAPPISVFAVESKEAVHNNIRWETMPCSYSMLVETWWYNFSTPDMYGDDVLTNRFPRGVPYVFDFAIRNGGSCPAQGQRPPPDYACLSDNSYCANVTNGYVCKCSDHYHGNPYITNGCQDIDECQLRKQNPELSHLYPCSDDGICHNRLGAYDCPCKPGMKGDGKAETRGENFPPAAKLILGLAGLIVVFVLMVMANQLLKLKKFYEQNGGPVLNGVENIRIYTRKQLKQITNNYKRVIGEGHFGKVYMGTLKDQHVAVKKSIKVDKDMKKEFTDEVIIQSKMRHKNIAMLLGCCLEMEVPMLVYEFLAKVSLYDVLLLRDCCWVSRRPNLYAFSRGEHHPSRDVKSGNILLDENFTP